MSAKKLIPFIIILAVLAGVAVLQKSRNTGTPITEQFTALAPTELSAKSIARVELYAGNDEDKVILEKDGEAWRVTSHFNAPAKTETVEKYLEKLIGIKGEFRAQAPSDEDLAAWELKDDEAFHVAAYKDSGDEPAVHLLIGKAPGYKSVFLRQAGSREVYEEATNLRRDAGVYDSGAGAKPKADHWLNKEVLKLDKEKVTRIALNYPDKKLVFEKREVPREEPEAKEGEEEKPAPPPVFKWALASGGLGGEAKETAINNILSKLGNLTATDVADPETPAEWGLDTPAFRCEIALEGEDPVVVEAGRPDLAGDAYVRLAKADTPTVYKVSSWNFEQLFPQGEDLFDLPKIDVTTDDITRITVQRPDNAMRFDKVGTSWKVVRPDVGLEAQTTTLSALATTLGTWKPEDYAAPGTKTGRFNRSVTFMAKGVKHTVRFGGPAKSVDGVYVKMDDNRQVFTMKDMDVKKILFPPRDAYKLALFDFNEDNVVRFDLSKGGKTVVLTRKNKGWTYTDGAATSPAEGEKCNSLLAALNDVQVADIRFDMTALDGKTYGAVTLYFKADDPLKITFGPEKDGKHLMAVEGRPRVFEMRKADVERLIGGMASLKKAKKKKKTPKAAESPAKTTPPANTSSTVTTPETSDVTARIPEAAKPAVEIPVPAAKKTDDVPVITIEKQ